MTAFATTANQNESAHDLVDKAADKIHKIINNAANEIDETKDAISQRLQVNPIASLILALGAGVVLDRLARNKLTEPKATQGHLPEVLLGLTALGQTAVSQVLYRRLFADTAKIAALTIFAALLAGVGAVGGFYTLYLMLLGYGVSAQTATASISAGAIVLAALIMTIAGRSIHRMHQTALWLPLTFGARKLAKKTINELKNVIG